MDHGIQAFFLERARSRLRVARLSVALGALLLVSLLILTTPPMARLTRNIPTMRFGFEGPPRYVELLRVEARPGASESMRDVGKVNPVRARRGEVGEPISSRRAKRTTQRHERAFDAGEETGDLRSRAIASQGR